MQLDSNELRLSFDFVQRVCYERFLAGARGVAQAFELFLPPKSAKASKYRADTSSYFAKQNLRAPGPCTVLTGKKDAKAAEYFRHAGNLKALSPSLHAVLAVSHC